MSFDFFYIIFIIYSENYSDDNRKSHNNSNENNNDTPTLIEIKNTFTDIHEPSTVIDLIHEEKKKDPTKCRLLKTTFEEAPSIRKEGSLFEQPEEYMESTIANLPGSKLKPNRKINADKINSSETKCETIYEVEDESAYGLDDETGQAVSADLLKAFELAKK